MGTLTLYHILTVVCSGQDTVEAGGRWPVHDSKGGRCCGKRRQAAAAAEADGGRDWQCHVQRDRVHQPPARKKCGTTE